MGAVSTGALSLDLALGVGGLPAGAIVEIFGQESSGKTTLVYHVIAEAQRRGGAARSSTPSTRSTRSTRAGIGVDIDKLLVSQPDTGEQALEIVELLIRSGALDVVAIDSVAALMPKAEIEGEMGDSHVGLQARLMSQALRKLAGNAQPPNTICMFTNQLREKIGVMFGSPETTPGGRALKFYSSVRLDIRRIETLKEGTEAVGNRVRVKVVKNKVAPPFKQAEFDVMYGQGISWEGTVLDVGLERKIVAKSGSYFSFGDERLGQGRQNATAFLQENPDLVQSILAADPGGSRPRADRLGAAPPARRGRHPGRRSGRRGRRGGGRGGVGRASIDGGMRTVTALRATRDARVAVELDDRPWRVVPAIAVVEAGLTVGSDSSALRCARSRGRFAATARRGWRFERSPRRERSRSELEERLARAGVREADRLETLDRAARAGLVDDVRFAQTRARALAERGAGDALILDDLARNGVEDVAPHAAVSGLPAEAARAARIVAERGRTAKTLRYLAARGFTEQSLDDLVAELENRALP